MERIESYRARDGKVFESEIDAFMHEATLDFKDWYQDNELYYAGCTIDADEMVAWLEKNREEVLKLLE